MLTRKTRRGIGIAALLAVMTWWLTNRDDSAGDQPIEGLDTRLDYALQNFEMRAYDKDGNPALTLRAPRLTNDATTRIGRVERPEVELVHEGFVWKLDADSAIISDDQSEVLLDGAVRLEREGARAEDRLQLDSTAVTLVVEERIAHSEAPVRVADPGGELRATGFSVNMLSNEFELFNDVQGRYVLPPQIR